MPSSPQSRRLYGAINSSIFGLNGSVSQQFDGDERISDFQLHPSIRNNWKSVDRIRDVLGYVPTVFVDDGVTYVMENLEGNILKTFKGTGQSSQTQTATSTIDYVIGQTQLASKLVAGPRPSSCEFHLVFDEDSWNDTTISHTEPTRRTQMQDLLHQDLEHTEYEGVPYFVRYFGRASQDVRTGLYTTDAKMIGATENVEPIFTAQGGEGTTQYIFDHTFEYYKYNQAISDGLYDIEVNSVYNYFLDSDPDYESIIGQTAVAEALIPNYYMLEISLNDTGPDTNYYMFDADILGPYVQQLSFAGHDTELVRQMLQGITPNSTTATQQISQGYLQYYAATLGRLGTYVPPTTTMGMMQGMMATTQGPPNISAGGHGPVYESHTLAQISTIYESDYKNIAVLTPEVQSGLLGDYNTIEIDNRGTENNPDDDLLAITSYPYYNEIIIHHDNQFMGPSSQVNFYDTLQNAGLTSLEAEKFLTLMQLYVCHQYGGSGLLAGAESFNIYDKTESGTAKPMVQETATTDLVFALEEIVQALAMAGSSLLTPRQQSIFYLAADLAEYYDYQSRDGYDNQGFSPNFVPLRTSFVNNYYLAEAPAQFPPGPVPVPPLPDWAQPQPVPVGVNAAAGQALLGGSRNSWLPKVAQAIIDLHRSVENFYPGVRPGGEGSQLGIAKSDPLMYVVEKRAISPGQLSASPDSDPVQTFFFGRDYVNNAKKGIVYYDTQIKYGVRYQYDIKQVRMVFGNKYSYGPSTQTLVTVPTYGRALGNALGFFADEQQSITDTAAHKAVVDKLGIAAAPNPQDLGPPVGVQVPSTDFTYLSEDGELLRSQLYRGFYGYYVYRWGTDATTGVQYTNADAYAQGIFYGADIENPLDSKMDVFMDLSEIKIRLVNGEGFQGNSTGGIIAGTPPPPEPTPDLENIGRNPFENLDGGLFEQIEDLGGAENQGGSQSLADRISQIENYLGAEWGARTEQWAQNKMGALDDLETVLAFAGALGGAGGGVDPQGPAGGRRGGDLLALGQFELVDTQGLGDMLESLGVTPPDRRGGR